MFPWVNLVEVKDLRSLKQSEEDLHISTLYTWSDVKHVGSILYEYSLEIGSTEPMQVSRSSN
jgi:hypothetical protein